MKTGLIHIYYGDGKGKTTAAMGQAIRAAGFGYRVLVFQFLKNNNSNERKILENISNITCVQGREAEKFSFQMNEKEKEGCRLYNKQKLNEIKELVSGYDVLVLDEAVCAVGVGLLEEEVLVKFLETKPEKLEVVLTGHAITEKLLNIADYVTEMRKVKHPFDKGIVARAGIEK